MAPEIFGADAFRFARCVSVLIRLDKLYSFTVPACYLDGNIRLSPHECVNVERVVEFLDFSWGGVDSNNTE
jgi:hypothetical protein